ncbi:carbohydrate kinase [Streptomyces spinoverrucosus]|uniref:Carbohydrate kinase n=1 Tax=Streptomyces spinoverrucosus TaxID=284043 RepID=A0A4Y3VFT3_9ACTN|nr:sugar kinase [Streptomyces spinoverrucosus]GEC05754.1 carbohydrate kinase [Streptomyces spinoverrucosus]GHB82841.1 carbohydrate kinase [Streptomyces spinoverrucosus]
MTATASCTAPDVVDVVALGESMVTFLPSRPGRLADVPSFDRGIGGAESNVACVMAAAGHTARWVSRVGEDGFGDHLVEAIGAYGVDVSSVRRDPSRPTGVYFRTAGDRAGDGHEVAYYRAGSAASAMAVGNVEMGAVRAARVLHLSGITAALSEDCLALMRELTAPAAGRPLVSFDVNHRQGLWRETGGPRILLELARDADIVFVGEDEAEEAWGVTGGPEAIRELLPEPGTLVVKQGAEGATVFERTPGPGGRPAAGRGGPVAPTRRSRICHSPAPLGSARPGRVVERAPHVSVVAPVGAGDAFAAGFLSGTLRGLPLRDRLRHGHLMAAAALTVPGDLATPPSRDHADRLAALDDDAWGRLRLGPGWTHAVDRAPEEVRTP